MKYCMQASDRTSYVLVLSSVRKDISVSIKFDFETNDHIAYFFGRCYLCTGCTKSIEMRKLPCMFLSIYLLQIVGVWILKIITS